MLRPYPQPSHRSPPRTGTIMYGRQHAAPLPTTISQITTQNRDNHVRETACCAPTHNHLTDHHPEPGQSCTGDSMLRPYPRPSHRSPPRTGTTMYGRQHAAPLPTTISQITTQNRDNHVRETAGCAPTHNHLTDHHPEPGQSCTGDSMLRPYPQPSHKSQPGTGQSCSDGAFLNPYGRRILR